MTEFHSKQIWRYYQVYRERKNGKPRYPMYEKQFARPKDAMPSLVFHILLQRKSNKPWKDW